jgi:hypothetical protein
MSIRRPEANVSIHAATFPSPMNETSNVIALRHPDEIEDPLTNILRRVRGSCLRRLSRWKSSEEKRRIVAAAIEPEAVASEVAQRRDSCEPLFRWRQQLWGLRGRRRRLLQSRLCRVRRLRV